MAPYRLVLLNERGAIHQELLIDCAHDDEAIERTGEHDHPHEMDLWQAGRHIVRFPPWPPRPTPPLRRWLRKSSR